MQLVIREVNLPYFEIFLEKKYLKDVFNFRVDIFREFREFQIP